MTAGGQETKLTKREAGFIQVIGQEGWPEFTVPMLQKVGGWSNSAIYKIIHGYSTHSKVYSSLLEKCPAISYCDRIVVTGEEGVGVSMRRRTNAYTFDRDLFTSWCRGGAVWIDDDPDQAGITSKTSTDSHNTSTGVEVFGNESSDPYSKNNSYNNNYLCTPDHFHKSQDTQQPNEEGRGASTCHYDPGNVEVQKSNPEQSRAIDGNTTQVAPISLPQTTSTAEIRGSVEVPPAASDPPPRIGVHDYRPLDHPEKRPCYVCGGELPGRPVPVNLSGGEGEGRARAEGEESGSVRGKGGSRWVKVQDQDDSNRTFP